MSVSVHPNTQILDIRTGLLTREGFLILEQLISAAAGVLTNSSVAGLPSATTTGQLIYVRDESGGAVVAFSDGLVWRRCTDRAIVS